MATKTLGGAGRRVRSGGLSLVMSVLFIGVLALVYVLATRNEASIDLTETQRFSLSDGSKQALAGLQTPIHIVGFFTSSSIDARDNATVLLRQYEQTTGGKVTFEFIDPDLEPTTAAAYGATRDQMLYAAREGDPPSEAEPISFAAERQITQAILKLVKAGDFKVYFVIGHGEKSSSGFDELGLSEIKRVLTDQYDIQAGELNLLEVTDVPEDASALVIPGPQSRFLQEEVDRLAAYLDRGGRVMILADPPTKVREENALDAEDPLAVYLRDTFGVRFLDNVVVSSAGYLQAFNPISDRVDGNHPTTQRLGQRPTVFFQVRSIEAPEPPPGVSTTGLIFTANSDYGETNIAAWLNNEYANDPAADTQGPLTLAMAVQRDIDTEREARLVLVGDSEFIVNSVWNLQGNPYFFADSIDWLTEFTAEITVEAVSDLTRLPVFATTQQQDMIAVVTILVMPFAVLAVGVVVWWSRSRQ